MLDSILPFQIDLQKEYDQFKTLFFSLHFININFEIIAVFRLYEGEELEIFLEHLYAGEI